MFPDNAKIACPPPLEKRTNDKHSKTNVQLVGALNNYSKIYKKIVTDFLISKTENHFRITISAYWKPFSADHIFI